MAEFDPLAVLVAALVAFLLSSAYYAVFASQVSTPGTEASAGTKPPPWKLGVEFLRALIVATVVAGLGARCEIQDWTGGLLLGLALRVLGGLDRGHLRRRRWLHRVRPDLRSGGEHVLQRPAVQ